MFFVQIFQRPACSLALVHREFSTWMDLQIGVTSVAKSFFGTLRFLTLDFIIALAFTSFTLFGTFTTCKTMVLGGRLTKGHKAMPEPKTAVKSTGMEQLLYMSHIAEPLNGPAGKTPKTTLFLFMSCWRCKYFFLAITPNVVLPLAHRLWPPKTQDSYHIYVKDIWHCNTVGIATVAIKASILGMQTFKVRNG